MLQLQVLFPPILALMGLAFLFNAVLRKFHDTQHEQVAFGLLFGAFVVLGMTNPLSLGEGLIFDTRTLLVGAAVAFVSPIAGSIALGFGLVCRIVIGGAGMASGIVGLVLAFGLALVAAKLLRKLIERPVLRDFLLGIAITPSAVAFFLLPFDLAVSLLVSVLPTLLIVNVVGMVAIGLVFRRERFHLDYVSRLADDAKKDELTKLFNRRGMDAEIRRTRFDEDVGHVLFYFDIDNFKQVNDTHGHAAGDAALAIVAARIKDSIREEAVIARHGGDEFSIYMPRLDYRDVRTVADRLRSAVSDQAFVIDSTSVDVSISIGAYWSKNDMAIQKMIDHADAQLLLAKQAGKNRAQVAYDKMGSEAMVA